MIWRQNKLKTEGQKATFTFSKADMKAEGGIIPLTVTFNSKDEKKKTEGYGKRIWY